MIIGKCDICKYGQTDKCTSPNRANNGCCEPYSGTTEIEKQIRADERAKVLDEIEKHIDSWWDDCRGAESKDDANWYISVKMLLEEFKEQK